MAATVRPVGRQGRLVDVAADDAPADLARGIAALQLDGVVDVVPGAATVLVRFNRDVTPDDEAAIARCVPVATPADTVEVVTIDVVYDGADLESAASLAGCTPAELIARHAAATYRSDFCGFAPGFAYLSGLDPTLHVPRRENPRTAVPAGAVAIAGPYTAVYPRRSPGGWQLIGTTAARLWDPQRPADPAVLRPGVAVRFRRVDALQPASEHAPVSERPDAAAGSLLVVDPGFATTIQDGGRPGFAASGLGRAGAVDRAALEHVNRLVGNPPGAAVLETAGGVHLEAAAALVIADSQSGTVQTLRVGERLRVTARTDGAWWYIAVRGGIDATAVLGSRSRDTMATLGPEPPRAGDVLAIGREPPASLIGDVVPLRRRIDDAVRISFGPRDDWFTAESRRALIDQEWVIGGERSRIGVRLGGRPLERVSTHRERELPSEGLVAGAIQVPPNGQPVVMLADHPTTGGYPVVAVIDPADLGEFAQRPSGEAVRFTTADSVRPGAGPLQG